MAAEGDQLRPDGHRSRGASFFKRVLGRVRASLKSRHLSRLPSRKNSHTASDTGRDMARTSEYLQICEENAIDAYTLEDALYWHNEIITELSIELNLVQTAEWPPPVKASMSAELEDRITQHSAAVMRLAALLEKNEPFIWQP